ncbi:hypothetical protein DL89DRAFT_318695 [Linderina pennispora]|uniref:glucan 1,4-alpha-glucosidase n=1 Tax=Linderina pennispora TaxID=61395 RepID=A0A1Y1W5F4_9FUNG|nr:uncharacterized protein DL89DRAFT_318695 [Linderina pennispora]ORX68760.1 hypothetical protein DL89DRAFT_318695 [Linderina pennispora]
MKVSFSFTSLLALSSLATGSLASTFQSAKWAAIPPDYNTALQFLANISPEGASPGAVGAAPSKSNPDYYYHWTHDAGTTLLEISTWLNGTSDASGSEVYSKKLADYANCSRSIQTIESPSGIGTAKFMMDGSAFTGAWCNPQRDGAAIRAISLISYARWLIEHSKDVSQYYDGKDPSESVIKGDLEYIASSWNADNNGCGIWEEIRGNHFYTCMIQRRAMIEGAQFAAQMGDTGTASMYESQAVPITGNMTSFWNNDKNLILPTINSNGGVNKPANIDSQVLLAALHASLGDGFYIVDSDQMLASVVAKTNAFKPLYPINTDTEATASSATMPIAVALGRYPKDAHNGYNSGQQGNPWSLITSGMADYHYRLVETWSTAGKVTITKATGTFFNQMKEFYGIAFTNAYEVGATHTSDSDTFGGLLANTILSGDRYMVQVAHHTDASGLMTEQWLCGEGTPTGAPNLIWSFEAHTSAAHHRTAASRIVYGN